MRKTGSQLVEYVQKVVQNLRTKIVQFSTHFRLSTIVESYTQICAHVMHRIIHTSLAHFTEVIAGLSPLSTALIYEHNMEIKN